jgi:hypothetical protein
LERDPGFMDRAVSTDTWIIASIPTTVMLGRFRIGVNVRSPTFTRTKQEMAAVTSELRGMMVAANTPLEPWVGVDASSQLAGCLALK